MLAAPAPSVLIHDYAGRTVTFRTEARTEGGTGEAGLHVLGSMPTGPISLSNLPAAPGRYVRPQ